MKRDGAAVRAVRWAVIGLGLAVPALSLVPLGSLWLWERGYLLWWAVLAAISTLTAGLVQRWLLKPPKRDIPEPMADAEEPGVLPDAHWTAQERAAWERVQVIVKEVDPAALTTRSNVVELGQRTVEAVALALHPERNDPLLQFTVPEALALVERVSLRMNAFVRENVPLGDRLTIAQMRALYEWRGSIDVVEKAWDVWRVVRMLNPATALANEVRERVSKELMAWGKNHVARRLATVFVEEVGRAAIDLYGGRLKVTPQALGAHVSKDSSSDMAEADAELAEPLRMLIGGQVSAGKSSLVNALAAEIRAGVDALPATARFTPYKLEVEGRPAALLIDSPGIEAGKELSPAYVAEAASADLILWVVAANRADREADRAALERLREGFAARIDRRPPPILLVLTHIDRLRPFQEWKPPYDLVAVGTPKAQSIRDAVEAAAADLGFKAAEVVPCVLSPEIGRYNVDAVWAAIDERLPEAQRARLIRTLRDAQAQVDVGRIWRQVVSGGRVLAETLINRQK